MKRKQVLALSCAIMMGTTTIAGFPMSVRAEEHIQMLEAVDDDAFLVAETDGIEIPENEKNVALGKSVTASSQENNNLGPDKLVDGKGGSASRWSSARGLGAQSVVLNLGQEYLLEGVNLFWESGKANSYSVLVSSDNAAWETAYRNDTHPANIRDQITFKTPVKGQYVKLQIDSISNEDPLTPPVPNWDTISLYEIQVLGTQAVQADKTKLQEMYDQTKGLEPKYNTNSQPIINNYNKAIAEAERLLADGTVTTQDEVDKATAELENRYYSFVVEEMNYYYSPNKDYFDYNQYTTESIKPLYSAYEATGNYNPNRPTEVLKKFQEDYLSAKEKVQQKPEFPRGMYIGLNSAFNKSTSSQAGEFVFRDYLKTNEDGTETPMLHIEFKNTGVNPMTGEKITNTSYLWDSFDFKEANILLSWTPYYPTEEVQGGTDWLNDYIENVSDEGFTADIPMEHGPGMYTVEMTSGQMKQIDSHGVYYSNEYAMQQNMAPVIDAKDVTLNIGDPFDPLANVTATDKEDGTIPLTEENIIANDVNTSQAGEYHVTYKVTDKDGASAEKTITVTVRQTEMEVAVSCSNDDGHGGAKWTNEDVTVTLTANKPVQPMEGWNLDETKTVLTKVHGENGTYTVTVTSEDGTEQAEVKYVVKHIDKQAPNVSVKGTGNEEHYREITAIAVHDTKGVRYLTVNGVKTMVNAKDEKLTDIKALGVVEGENTAVVVDKAGNQTEIKFHYDTEKPEFKWIVDNNTQAQSKEVRLETSEEIQLPDSEWKLQGEENGTFVYVKTFHANWKDKKFTVTDLAGNVSDPQFVEVKRIDNSIPTVTELTQDITEWTKKDVTVTIKTSTDCQTPEGWKKVNKRTFTKVFSENGDYSVTLTSVTGVPGEAYPFSITNIDKEAPVIDYKAIEAANGYKREIPVNEGEEYTEKELVEMFTKPEWVTDNSGHAEFKVDKWELEHGLDGYKPFTSKTPGTYKVRFYAYDAAGNSSTFDVYVKVLEPETPEERTTTVNYTVFLDNGVRTGTWTHTGTEEGTFEFEVSMTELDLEGYVPAEGETGSRTLTYGETTSVTFYLVSES